MLTVDVAAASGSYIVEIEHDLLDAVGPRLMAFKRHAWMVIADDTVAGLYGYRVLESMRRAGLTCQMVAFPGGEVHKTLATVETLTARMLAAGLARDGGVLALGGGLVGDVAGLTAALFMRGIPYVQLPTTLLAIIDASVGGKTAVNMGEVKNCLGRFHQPLHVCIDPATLRTLPDDEFQSGLGELAKYAILDADFYDWITANAAPVLAQEPAPLAEAIARCVAIKARVVAADEQEAGQRMLLNYGHTFGHGLESLLRFAKPHGWCVAQGMRLAAALSQRLGLCEAAFVEQQDALLASLGLLDALPSIDAAALLAAMQSDKKKQAGGLTFILPRKVGELEVARGVDDGEVRSLMSWYTKRR